MTRALEIRLVCIGWTLLASCRSGAGQPSSPPGVALGALTVTSTAFKSGGAIPVDFTCDGADRSPSLTLSAPPQNTRSLAVIVDDPDAPGGTFTHWIIYNLRPETLMVPEATDAAALGAVTGTNDFKRVGYAGPCPPKLEGHQYRFRVLALDAALPPEPAATRATIDAAMSGHLLGEGTLVGVYSR